MAPNNASSFVPHSSSSASPSPHPHPPALLLCLPWDGDRFMGKTPPRPCDCYKDGSQCFFLTAHVERIGDRGCADIVFGGCFKNAISAHTIRGCRWTNLDKCVWENKKGLWLKPDKQNWWVRKSSQQWKAGQLSVCDSKWPLDFFNASPLNSSIALIIILSHPSTPLFQAQVSYLLCNMKLQPLPFAWM